MDSSNSRYPPPSIAAAQAQPYYSAGVNGYDMLEESDDADNIAALRQTIESASDDQDQTDGDGDSDSDDSIEDQDGAHPSHVNPFLLRHDSHLFDSPDQNQHPRSASAQSYDDDQDSVDKARLRAAFAEMAADSPRSGYADRGSSRGRTRGRGRGRGGWRAVLRKQGLEDFFAKPKRSRTPKGEGRRGGVSKGTRTGPRAPAEPSIEFKELQGKAMSAYLAEDLATAEHHVQRAIEINPEIFAAHSLLSEIYTRMGRREDADTVLWVGSYARNDPKIWWEITKRIIQNPSADPADKQDRLLECYSRIVKLDKSDYAARAKKLAILVEQNQYAKAIQSCKTMLKRRPFDLEVIRTFVDQCLKGDKTDDLANTRRARDLYLKALGHYQKQFLDGVENEPKPGSSDDDDDDAEHLPDLNPFTLSDVNILLEAMVKVRDWEAGIKMTKSSCRWLSGRAKATYWDNWNADDREWDVDDAPRRIQVPQFRKHDFDISTYGESMPLEIRAKLGICRLFLGSGHRSEALGHFEHFDLTDNEFINEYVDDIIAVGLAFYRIEDYNTAYEWFKAAQGPFDVSEFQKCFSYEANVAAARTCVHADQLEDALIYYRAAITQEPSRVFLQTEFRKVRLRLEPRELPNLVDDALLGVDGENEAKSTLTTDIQHIAMGDHGADRSLAMSGIPVTMGSKDDMRDHQNFMDRFSDGQEPRKRLKAIRSRNFFRTSVLTRENIADNYAVLQERTADMREADPQASDEWVDAASQLVSAFLSVPGIFTTSFRSDGDDNAVFDSEPSIVRPPEDRELGDEDDEDTNPPTQRANTANIPTEKILGISCLEWFDVFSEYALVTAREDDQTTAYDTIQSIKSVPYFTNSGDLPFRTHVLEFSCALLLEDDERLTKASRWFMSQHPGTTDAFRLYTLLFRLHHGESRLFADDTNQKFIMRKIKLVDFLLLPDEARRFWGFSDMERRAQSRVEEEMLSGPPASRRPSLNDPVIMAMYGHILLASESSKNAIQYLMRAYAMKPGDPMICISLATAYTVHAMKRQSANRHYFVLTAIGFMQEYKRSRLLEASRASRKISAREYAVVCEEVAFNEGRMWQLLGLFTEAVGPFERCLDTPFEVEVPVGDTRVDTSDGTALERADVEMGDYPHATVETIGFKREAAYSLQSIYLLSGNTDAALELSRTWLVYS